MPPIGKNPPSRKPTGRQGQPEGQPSSGGSSSVLQKMVDSGQKRIGDKYGVGQHKYAPVGGAVSCSGLIYSMRQDAGLPNPYWGTYGYMDHYATKGFSNNYSPLAGKQYSAGTLFISTSGAGGTDGTHVAMSIGGGKVIESVYGNGVQIKDQPGSFKSGASITTGIMPDVGTGVIDAIKNPGEAVGNAVSGAVEGAAGDIAEGIASGLLRVLKYVYGKVILQPIDFFSGFWWEFLKHFWTEVGGADPGVGDQDGGKKKTKQTEEVSPDAPEWGSPTVDATRGS